KRCSSSNSPPVSRERHAITSPAAKTGVSSWNASDPTIGTRLTATATMKRIPSAMIHMSGALVKRRHPPRIQSQPAPAPFAFPGSTSFSSPLAPRSSSWALVVFILGSFLLLGRYIHKGGRQDALQVGARHAEQVAATSAVDVHARKAQHGALK